MSRFRFATRVARGRLHRGTRGTVETLRIMRRLVAEGSRDPVVRQTARRVLAGASPSGDPTLSALGALHRFVSDQIKFTPDLPQAETLQSPAFTLRFGAGDCDDKSTLLASLAGAAGLSDAPMRFRVVAADARAPRSFSHVYLVARHGLRDVPLDATYSGTPMGWQVPVRYRTGDFPL